MANLITTELALISSPRVSNYYSINASLVATAANPFALFIGNTGYPTAFTTASPGLAGATITSASTTGGFLPFSNPTTGNTYLTSLSAESTNNIQSLQLCDLLWYNSGIVAATTTAQTINSVTLPPRDANGSTSGVGVIAWLVLTGAAITAANTTATISYTNSSGTTGMTGTIISGFAASSGVGSMLPFSLAAGDVGVQSIQSITLGTSFASSTPVLMLIRDISAIGFHCGASGTPSFYNADWSQLGFPQLFNNSALAFRCDVAVSGTTAVNFSGKITFSYSTAS